MPLFTLPIQLNGDLCESMDLDLVEAEDKDPLPVVDHVNIDLENHMRHYKGLPLIYRLEFVADHCRSLKIDALNMAINYIKENTYNVKDYLRLFKKLQEALIADQNTPTNMLPQADNSWVDTKTKQAGLRFERLDTDLKNYRCNAIKESIRRGQDDLGDHFLDCGELDNAFTAYSKSRDYTISHKNQIIQCLNMIRVSILLNRWQAVQSHVARAEHPQMQDSGPLSTNPNVETKLHCAAGLYELNTRKYKKAACHFLQTNFEHFTDPSPSTAYGPYGSSPVPSSSSSSAIPTMRSSSNDIPSSAGQWAILAPVNIAVYGSLCALATLKA